MTKKDKENLSKMKMLLRNYVNSNKSKVDIIPPGAIRNLYRKICWRCNRVMEPGVGFVFKTSKNASRWTGQHGTCPAPLVHPPYAKRDYEDPDPYSDVEWGDDPEDFWGF